MTERTKYYFISDCHLDALNHENCLEREKKLVAFLEEIKSQAKALYLLGDIFDFWFEYKYVVPRGYVRFLGKLAELSDSGVEIHYFTGNHDIWTFSYFEKEFNVQMHRKPCLFKIEEKKFFIGHGDGLGPCVKRFNFLKNIFTCWFFQRLFALIHPTLAFSIADFFSKRSRKIHADSDCIYKGDDKESLVVYIKSVLEKEHFDYFIFGHRHLPIDMRINDSRYINLGEWTNKGAYAVFDGRDIFFETY